VSPSESSTKQGAQPRGQPPPQKGRQRAASRSPSGPTRSAARFLDPRVQLWSLCLLQSRHFDVPGPVGGSEWRWGGEVCAAEEDDVHRDVVGGQVDDPAKFW